MKKFIFLILFIASATLTHAQFIEKGAIVGSGSVWLNFTSHDDYSTRSFSLQPWAGFFIIDDLAIGGQLSVSTSSTSGDNFATYSSSSFAVGPIARYYLPFGVFFQADAGFGAGSTNSDVDYSLFWAGAGVGYAVKVGESAFLEPMIGLESRNENYDGNFEDDASVNIYLGASFTVKLKKGK
jgi:outer membrane protein